MRATSMIEKNIANILATGSTGNCVLYFNYIAIDMGISFVSIKPHLKNLKLLLLTHEHLDHFKISTIKRIQFERPALRIGCCKWMLPLLDGLKNIDVYEIGQLYDYGQFQISPFKLYHDVENCGYRIFKDDIKVFHATDTAHLNGITAKEYDLFAIEHNYNEDTVFDTIKRIELAGGYAHQKGSINSHLSEQQAKDFIFKNKKETSEVIRLHESKTT